MVDPSLAMESFQEAFTSGVIHPKRCTLDRELHVLLDNVMGESRITYVRLEGQTVTAFVNFAENDPIDDIPCFGIGYAVPAKYQKQGRARDIVNAALAEMQHGLAKHGIKTFYVEAIVEINNKPSQRVAEQVISNKPVATTDQHSGLPAFQYVRKLRHP